MIYIKVLVYQYILHYNIIFVILKCILFSIYEIIILYYYYYKACAYVRMILK
jgi:hypothetical protein